jgi:hypothetical protein
MAKTKTKAKLGRERKHRTIRVRRKPRCRAKKKTQKGGCVSCVALLPAMPAVAAVGGAGLAIGSLFSMESTMKKTKKGSFRQTVMRKSSKKGRTKSKVDKVVIKLLQKGRKSTLYKNRIKRKIKGDPVQHYNRLIQECEDKGFKKC